MYGVTAFSTQGTSVRLPVSYNERDPGACVVLVVASVSCEVPEKGEPS
jgi:hypothetical protein